MRPLRCLVTTLIGGTVLMGITTGCAEKRYSTRHLTEPWPPPATQEEAAARQTGEMTVQGEEATQRTEDTTAREVP